VYEREAVLGRDAASVFPKRMAAEPLGQAEKGLADRKFISQSEVGVKGGSCGTRGGGGAWESLCSSIKARTTCTAPGFAVAGCCAAQQHSPTHNLQLDEIKAKRGGGGDGTDESGVPLRPLSEVLRENRDKKQQAFEDQWKQMKTGACRGCVQRHGCVQRQRRAEAGVMQQPGLPCCVSAAACTTSPRADAGGGQGASVASPAQHLPRCAGKNRPLADEDLEFFDGLAEAEAARYREASQAERDELREFRKVRRRHVSCSCAPRHVPARVGMAAAVLLAGRCAACSLPQVAALLPQPLRCWRSRRPSEWQRQRSAQGLGRRRALHHRPPHTTGRRWGCRLDCMHKQGSAR